MEHHRQGNINSRPKGLKEQQLGEKGAGKGGSDGGGGWVRCCWLMTYLFENSARILHFTPGNFRQKKPLPLETPQNCVTPLGNFKRPKIKTPRNFT